MSASSKGGYGGPNTAGPGGQGRDYNGNAIGSRMPGQFAVGGLPRAIGGPAPIPGGRPAPGDLYRPQPGGGQLVGGPAGRPIFGGGTQPGREPEYAGMPDELYNSMKAYQARRALNPDAPENASIAPWEQWLMDKRGGGDTPPDYNYMDTQRPDVPTPYVPVTGPAPENRFTPRGIIPPAGARPQPGQPTGPYTRQRYPAGDPRRYGGQPQPNPRDVIRGVINPIFGGIGGGKGGFPGPRAIGGPAPLPSQPFDFNAEAPYGRDSYGNALDNPIQY